MAYWIHHAFISYQGYLTHGTAMAETGIVRAGIPIFLIAIVVELLAAKIMGMDVYRLNDSMRSLGNKNSKHIYNYNNTIVSCL